MLLCTCIGVHVEADEAPSASQDVGAPVHRLFDETARREVDYSKIPTVRSTENPQSADLISKATAPGDKSNEAVRVAFLGDTLIDRARDFGYVETELTRRLPNTNIVFRNLGWPGDTVAGVARIEFGPGEYEFSRWRRPSAEIGEYGLQKMMSHLRRARPHVLFVAYGSNVAFEGAAGVERYRVDLETLLDTLETTGVQVVLMSPPPREIQDGLTGPLEEQNRWLSEAAGVLRDVASRRKLAFLDLFGEWPRDRAKRRYTDNGIHLNTHGYQTMATLIANWLFQPEHPYQIRLRADGVIVTAKGADASDWQRTEYGFRWRVRDRFLPSIAEATDAAGSDSRERGRTLRIDGLTSGVYSLDIDGQRVARGSALDWATGLVIQNGPDFERLERLRQAILRKNRLHFYGYRPQNKAYIHLFRRHERGHHAPELERFDLRIAGAEDEIARLRVSKPRIYELTREKDYPDHEVPGETAATSVADELAALTIPDGFEISLFASDPAMAKPININWDEHGRMWVATSSSYPHLQPGQTPNDRILILEDIDRDGRADKSTVFADGLLVPQSVIPGHGGAYVAQSTELLFLRDADGDGKADERRVLLTGFGNADVHHMIHGLRWGPDGDLYFTQSIYINSTVETPWGLRTANGSCTWRLRPDTLRLETFSQGLVNPWGHAFDEWGQSFATDGAGGSGLSYLFPGAAYQTNGYAGRELQAMNPGRPKECGLELLSGRHLPEAWRGTYLTNDFRANHVTRYRLTENGSGYRSEFLGNMVSSKLRSFRPVDVKMGPDGAIYIVDWYNYIIDHGEVDFHHPLRDKRRGRIWRLRVKDTPLLEWPRLADAAVPELLRALQSPEQWTRDQARRLLREQGPEVVLPTLRQWLADEIDTRSEHERLEALWVCQGLRIVDGDLLRQLLKAQDYRVRAAAVRVLSDWFAQVSDAAQRLENAVEDEHAQVRLEAVNALRLIGTKQAVALAMRALDRPVDRYLDFALFRTAHELRDVWMPSFLAGESLFENQPHRISFALLAVSDGDSVAPLADLVRRDRMTGPSLVAALAVMARVGGGPEYKLLLDRLTTLDADGAARVLAALAQSSRTAPSAGTENVVALLDHADARVRRLAMQLAGRWKLSSALPSLQRRARNSQAAAADRLEAAQAISAIESRNGATTLKAILDEADTDSVRITTVAAMVDRSPDVAARLAVEWLSTADDADLARLLMESFLHVRNAHVRLTEALDGIEISSGVAETLIATVRLSGREYPELIRAIQAAGQLKSQGWKMTDDQIAGILHDVGAKGDVHRGKTIYMRKQLQCVTCHAIDGQGGSVGPDLSSLGGSARLGDILMSLLEPSASIKEGYQTTNIITIDGRVVTGIVQQETDSLIHLRDANDQLVTLPIGDVDEIAAHRVSIMPSGLTESLTRDELVDLLCFLSSLGRTN